MNEVHTNRGLLKELWRKKCYSSSELHKNDHPLVGGEEEPVDASFSFTVLVDLDPKRPLFDHLRSSQYRERLECSEHDLHQGLFAIRLRECLRVGLVPHEARLRIEKGF